MKRFLCRVIGWALLPAALLLGLGYGVWQRSGENLEPYDLVERTVNGEDLAIELYYSGSEFTAWYKGKVAFARGAEVLALGTSRVMQLRACMLPGADFYNAGGTNSHLTTMVDFLEHFEPENLPDTILLGLDQYFFSSSWMVSDSALPWTYHYANLGKIPLTSILSQYGSGKFTLRSLYTAPEKYIGLPAATQRRGFLKDGSYYYGQQALDGVVDLTFADAIQRIQRGGARFEPCAEISPDSLARLTELLDWCETHGITVVAFVPPYPPSVYNAMIASGQYPYLDGLFPALREVFEQYPDFELYDFTLVEGATDEQFVDGLHGGDVVYARMVEQMAEDGCLGQYTDRETLEALIAGAENPRVIEPVFP